MLQNTSNRLKTSDCTVTKGKRSGTIYLTNGFALVISPYMNKISSLSRKLTNSKEGKRVFTNFGYLSLLQIAGYAFPFITMPYLARVIGVDGFGKISFAAGVIIWFQAIADWGFNLTATRDVAQNRSDKEKVSQIYSDVLWARCFLTVISGLILLILIKLVPYFSENGGIIFITFLLVPGHILFPDWFFQAIERMKYTTLFNLIIKLIFTVAVFIFIKNKQDYIFQPLLTTIGYLVCGIAAQYLILKKWHYKIYRPNLKKIFITIKESSDVFINSLMPNLYNSLSIILLGFFGGAPANGIYDGGNRFPTIFYNLQSVLSRAFYPFLSRRPEKHKVFSQLNIGSAMIGAIILIIGSPLIIRIMLGPDFIKSIIVMQILSLSVIFLAMSNTYGANYLIIHHKERQLRNLTFICSIIGMCLSFPLVYYFTYIGAALTVLICRGLLGVGSMILAKKIQLTINSTSKINITK